jgi:3-oxoadipate enol-lactonase
MVYQSKNGNIFYKDSRPDDPFAVIFCHGVGMDHRTFQHQSDALQGKYRTLLWDLPGHGQSTLTDYNTRYSHIASLCLQGLIQERKIEKAVLVGQSLGSLVIQRLQLQHPQKVAGMVHIGGMQLAEHIGSWLRTLAPAIVGMYNLIPEKTFYTAFGRHRAEKPEIQNYLAESISRTGKKLVLQITKDMIFDLTENPGSAEDIPSLLIYGETDLSMVRESTRKWHRSMPNSLCFEIPMANHIANQDNPEEFNKRLFDFLDGIKTDGFNVPHGELAD